MSESARLAELRANARYARERRDLYRAKALTGRPMSPERLRTLERESDQAEERLQAAVALERSGSGGGSPNHRV